MRRFFRVAVVLMALAGCQWAVCADEIPQSENLAIPQSENLAILQSDEASLVESCRAMVPANVKIDGRIILRNRRGMVQAEYGYTLRRVNGETKLVVRDSDGAEVPFEAKGRLLGTDVTWSDLTLDYLWWDDFGYDAERESETVHGQVCSVILMRSGERTVRVWVDRKTGAMMQAEELAGDKPVRRLWGTRIKKFGERWAPNVLEVETIGSGHRTKIIVEELT